MRHLLLFRSLVLLALLGVAAAAPAAERTTYFVPDALGSPVAAMDEQGNVLWRESYAPYGERKSKTPDNTARAAYTGKPEDAGTGLVYMGARMYDPESARFTGIDPQGFGEANPQSFGRYLYGNNAPYVFVDPDGEVPVLIPVAIFLAKEGAGFAFEATTGVPAVFSVKGLAAAVRKANKSNAFEAALGQARTVLWSGSSSAKHEAAAYAAKVGGSTLEMTPAGKLLSETAKNQPFDLMRPAWISESRKLVDEAHGIVDVFLAKSGVRKGSIFLNEELPALKSNAKVTGIVIHPAGRATSR